MALPVQVRALQTQRDQLVLQTHDPDMQKEKENVKFIVCFLRQKFPYLYDKEEVKIKMRSS